MLCWLTSISKSIPSSIEGSHQITGAVSDVITQYPMLVNTPFGLDIGQYRIQGVEIAVNIRENCEFNHS